MSIAFSPFMPARVACLDERDDERWCDASGEDLHDTRADEDLCGPNRASRRSRAGICLSRNASFCSVAGDGNRTDYLLPPWPPEQGSVRQDHLRRTRLCNGVNGFRSRMATASKRATQ